MSDAGIQPTLSDGNDLGERLNALDLIQVASWLAFERSTISAASVSTGIELTQELFATLVQCGVLREPRAGDRHVRRALYEPFAWTYPDELGVQGDHLEAQLAQILSDRIALRATLPSARAKLWTLLAKAELSSYLTHLMRKHAMDPAGAATVVHALRDELALHSLGRQRYLVWHAVRGGAAALVQSRMDQEWARQRLVEELRRRSRWLLLRRESKDLADAEYCFIPELGRRIPLMLQLLQEYFLSDPATYWIQSPSRADTLLVR